MPPVVPCTITVLDKEVPVEGVSVQLIPTSPASWLVTGKTDASGRAVLETRLREFTKPGVPPVGEFKVTLAKAPIPPPLPPQEELAKMDELAMNTLMEKRDKATAALPRPIPAILTDQAKTPLSLDVTAGTPADLTIDVAAYKK